MIRYAQTWTHKQNDQNILKKTDFKEPNLYLRIVIDHVNHYEGYGLRWCNLSIIY